MRSLWAALYALGVAVPLFSLFHRILGGGAWGTAFLEPGLLAVVRFTITQALLSAGLALLIGSPLAWMIRNRPSLDGWVLLPFALPGAVAAMGWSFLLSADGMFPFAYSARAVVLAHGWMGAPWVAVSAAFALREIDSRLLDSARSLGAGTILRLRAIEVPAASRALISAFLQVFVFSAMSFTLVLILGGGPPVETLETVIYSRLRSGELDVAGAAAAAIWQLLICGAPWLAALRLESRLPRIEGAGDSREPKRAKGSLAAGSALLLLFLPFLWTFLPREGGSLAWAIRSLFAGHELAKAAGTSVLLAAGSSLGAVGFAGLAVRAETISLAPMGLLSGVSALALGVGAWSAYAGRLFDPIDGNPFLLACLQAILFSPFVFRSFWAIRKGSPKHLHDAARSLGAKPLARFFAIEWPRYRPALSTALALCFAASLGELGGALLFSGQGMLTLPVLLARKMSLYRFEEAQAISLFLLLLAASPLIGLHFFNRKKVAWTRLR